MFSVTSRTADELSRNYLRHRIETSKAREYRIEKTINLVFRAFLRSSWENSSQNSPEKNAISILVTAIESVDISLCTCANLTSVMVVELMAPKVSECAELRGTGHFPAKTTFAHAYTMGPTFSDACALLVCRELLKRDDWVNGIRSSVESCRHRHLHCCQDRSLIQHESSLDLASHGFLRTRTPCGRSTQPL